MFRRVYVRFAVETNATDASVNQKKEQIKRNARNERKRKKGRNVYDRCIFMRREDATVVQATRFNMHKIFTFLGLGVAFCRD